MEKWRKLKKWPILVKAKRNKSLTGNQRKLIGVVEECFKVQRMVQRQMLIKGAIMTI